MLRWCSQLAVKPFLMLLALSACALAESGPPSPTLGEETPFRAAQAVALPEPTPRYSLQDGTILYDGQAKTADDGQATAPGKVDALDIKKAYERANKLSGQAKGRVFKTS